MAALLRTSGDPPDNLNIHIISIAMETSIMPPEVSVIVPTLNEGRYLKRALASIANQNTLASYELIVADSKSTDGSLSITERYADTIIQCEGKGIGAGRHCGAKHAGGKYLMFIDADTILPCYYIARLCDRFTYRDLVAFSAVFRFSEQSQSAKLAEKVTNQYRTMRDKVLDPTLPGFNTCSRKDAYIEIGGYRNAPLEGIEFETFYHLPEVGFGKPQRAQRTQRQQQLSVLSASSVVNLLRHNLIHPEKIKKSLEFSRMISQIGKTGYFDGVVVITSPRRLDGMGLLRTLYYYTQLKLGRAIDRMIYKMSKKLGIANLRDYVGIRWQI